MGYYDWVSIMNLVLMGYLIKLLVDILVDIKLFVGENNNNFKLMIKNIYLEFKNKKGIGTLSIIIFILGFVWLANCDEILRYFKLTSWTNGDSGKNIGICYCLLFFIPSYILAAIYKDDFGTKFVKKFSRLFNVVFVLVVIFFIIY